MPRFLHFLLMPKWPVVIFSFTLLAAFPNLSNAQPTVILTILNPQNSSGKIVISSGTSVEVEFQVTGEASNNDELQLVRLSDNTVVSQKKRGNSTTGAVNLHTNSPLVGATLKVQYVHAGIVVTTATPNVTVVADEGSVILAEQISALQDVNNIQGANIATNTGNIATNTTNIGLLTTEVSANMAAISNLQSDVTTLQNDVALLQGSGSGLIGSTTSDQTALGVGAGGSSGSGLVAIGANAMPNNTSGFANIALGGNAMFANTSGNMNTALGHATLDANTTGSANTAVGTGALGANVTGFELTALGAEALNTNTGNFNTALGRSAMQFNTTGASNTAVGLKALRNNSVGSFSTAFGINALQFSTGSSNTAIGSNAGSSLTTGNNNIYINNSGNSSESGIIRIGSSGLQTSTFIAGIRGVTTGQFDAVDVVIDSNGQLGTVSSSRRYKEEIHDIGTLSEKILELRPVSFRYKQAQADGSKPLQYGLVAEEVAQVFPELVVYDKQGQEETIQYRKLIPLLLNELKKAHHINQTQETQFREQQEQNRALIRQIMDLTMQFTKQNEMLKVRIGKLEDQIEEQNKAIPVSLH